MSSTGSNASRELPEIDERIVAPESGYEIDDGKLVRVPPSDPPHAECHANLSFLLGAHVAPGYRVGLDLLTRTSEIDDIAPDASVYPSARNPRTGGRQLEQLAFEIASTESLGHSAGKARKLTGRGVRRVFAIDVDRSRVLEWSVALATWSILDPKASIEDVALAVPLPVEALVDATRTDEAVVRALIARRHPVLEGTRLEGRLEGRLEQAIEAVLVVLSSRGLVPTPAEREQILHEENPARLERWLARAALCASIAELLEI